MTWGIVVGPVLKRPEGYGFDVWTVTKGVIPGYPYRRIEDAYYARNAEIRASAQGRCVAEQSGIATTALSGQAVERLPLLAQDAVRHGPTRSRRRVAGNFNLRPE